MTLQFGALPTDDTRSVNYDCNMFLIQATGFSWVILSSSKRYSVELHGIRVRYCQCEEIGLYFATRATLGYF